jgi:hypothetical protein
MQADPDAGLDRHLSPPARRDCAELEEHGMAGRQRFARAVSRPPAT